MASKRRNLDLMIILKHVYTWDDGEQLMATRGQCLKWRGVGGAGHRKAGRVFPSLRFHLLEQAGEWKQSFLAPEEAVAGIFNRQEARKFYIVEDPQSVPDTGDVILVCPLTKGHKTIDAEELLDLVTQNREDLEIVILCLEGDRWSRHSW